MIHLNKLSTEAPESMSKEAAEKELGKLKDELAELQNVLYAESKHSILVVLQGMDGSGKDGTIRHVFTSINPQGIQVKSYKAPTAEEAAHDFLWRVHPHAPARGMIQIFNRSHYEDILYPTIHKTFDKKIIKKRYDIINNFEDGLKENGTVILKFFLHISKAEQKERLAARLLKPHKKWKYNANDKKEARHWNGYMATYQEIINRCSPAIPWVVVPADSKWYRNYAVAKKMVDELKQMKMKYPSSSKDLS